MADLNYISPSGLAPNLGQVPAGLAGIFMGQQQGDYRQMMDLQKIIGIMNTQRKAAENREWYDQAPLRELQDADKVQQLSVGMQTRPELADLDLQKRRRDNEKGTIELSEFKEVGGTAPPSNSRVAAARAGNESTIATRSEQEMQKNVNYLSSMVDVIREGDPMTAPARARQVMEDAGISPTSALGRHILAAQTPEEMASRIERFRDRLVDDIKTRQQRAIIDRKGEWAQNLKLIDVNGRIDLAYIRGQMQRAIEAAKASSQPFKESMSQFRARMYREAMAQSPNQAAAVLSVIDQLEAEATLAAGTRASEADSRQRAARTVVPEIAPEPSAPNPRPRTNLGTPAPAPAPAAPGLPPGATIRRYGADGKAQ